MSMRPVKFTDKNEIIDAVEIGSDFVTVYINSNEPGQAGSFQKQFIEKYKEILPNPYHHDPNRFHEEGDPRGSKWRTWENKYACHFHFLGYPKFILNRLKDEFSPTLQEKINETICN